MLESIRASETSFECKELIIVSLQDPWMSNQRSVPFRSIAKKTLIASNFQPIYFSSIITRLNIQMGPENGEALLLSPIIEIQLGAGVTRPRAKVLS